MAVKLAKGGVTEAVIVVVVVVVKARRSWAAAVATAAIYISVSSYILKFLNSFIVLILTSTLIF